MTHKPFNYADCHPHRDGKRRAIDGAGRIQVLLCNDAPGKYPIVGYCEGDYTFGVAANTWTKNGIFNEGVEEPQSRDLVGPAPEKPRRWWINAYDGKSFGNLYGSKEEADEKADPSRIECICVEEVKP